MTHTVILFKCKFLISFHTRLCKGTFTVSWTNLKGQSKNLVISYWKVNAINWHCTTWKTLPGDTLDNTVPFINLLHYLLCVGNIKLTKSITIIYPCPDGRWSSIPNILKKKGPDKNHSASMSKQESKMIKDTQEKNGSLKKKKSYWKPSGF